MSFVKYLIIRDHRIQVTFSNFFHSKIDPFPLYKAETYIFIFDDCEVWLRGVEGEQLNELAQHRGCRVVGLESVVGIDEYNC